MFLDPMTKGECADQIEHFIRDHHRPARRPLATATPIEVDDPWPDLARTRRRRAKTSTLATCHRGRVLVDRQPTRADAAISPAVPKPTHDLGE
jgi:hypothetical protein